MTPDARIAAVIELLSEIVAAAESGGSASDTLVRRFFASRRYAGSKDRRYVSDAVYAALRDWQGLAWRVAKSGGAVSPRTVVLAWLNAEGEGEGEADVSALFTGEGHAPDTLSGAEEEMLKAMPSINADDMPEQARLNCPAWLEASAFERFGEALGPEMMALNGRAPLDLRVNTLKSSRDEVLASLKEDGIEAVATPVSPIGIRIAEPRDLSQSRAMKSGQFEVQDEGAQIASLLVDAGPKAQVIDLCAGAGGKTLALAASMANSGQIHACDNAGKRLDNLKKRAKKAGARNIQPHRLPSYGEKRDRILGRFAGKADRVVLDVPCSGSGTWRRNPELRLRLTSEMLAELTHLQGSLLEEGAAMVKPGGRLIYITCSFLPEENEDRIAAFLADHSGWQAVEWRSAWPDGAGEFSAATNDLADVAALRLSPHGTGTDAFFVSILECS